MGMPAARVGDMTSHGTPLAPGPGSSDVFIGNMPAWRALTDQHTCPVSSPAPHGSGMVAVGSTTVFINNMQAARQGDMVTEATGGPNPITLGCTTVLIG